MGGKRLKRDGDACEFENSEEVNVLLLLSGLGVALPDGGLLAPVVQKIIQFANFLFRLQEKSVLTECRNVPRIKVTVCP